MKKLVLCIVFMLLCTLCLSGCFTEESPHSENKTVSSTLSTYAFSENQINLSKISEDTITKGYLAKNWTGNEKNYFIKEKYVATYKNRNLVNNSNNSSNRSIPLELQLFKLNSTNLSLNVIKSIRKFGIKLGLEHKNITTIGNASVLFFGNKTIEEREIIFYTFYVSIGKIIIVLKGTAPSQQKFLSFAEIIEENIVEQRNQTG